MPATIFLSYARGDDEPFVRRLHGDLTKAGFDVWFDRDDMRARGLTFIDEIKHAISERDRLVFITGPAAVASPYVRMEWEHALASDKCVNPIVRKDGRKADGSVLDAYALMPEELAFLHAENFRDDTQYAAHLANLIRQLSDAPPPLGKLIAVPSMDAIAPHLIRQAERIRALRDALLSDLQSKPVGSANERSRVGLDGMGGIGKSVLACVLAHDRQVRQSYPDGIFWLPFGQQPNLVQLQRNVAKALGDEGAFENDAQGRAKLRELLLGKAALLICDDVWEAHHATAFDVLGPRCRALITTRDAGLLHALHAQEFRVQLLTGDEALALLAKAAGTDRAALPAEAREVARECDHLPLALALCGGMAFGPEGIGWADILGALRNADLPEIATDHPLVEQHASLWKAITLSVQRLTPEEQRRWAELSVFPEDETVPEAAVRTLWTHTGAMSSIAIGNLLKRLASRSLLYLDPVKGDDTVHRLHRVSLHDLLHDYAKRLAGDRPALHRQMLDAYAAQCPAGWPSGPDDGWFLQHLRDHLCAAGRTDEFASLLLELRWLERKNEAGLTFDLAEDFTAAVNALPQEHVERQRLRLLGEALRRDIHFIARHAQDYRQALFQCLWNSAWWYDCPEAAHHFAVPEGEWKERLSWQISDPTLKLCTLLERWRSERDAVHPGFHWLRTLRPLFTHLGAGQLAVLYGHQDWVWSVAFSPDGKRVLSGSFDGTVRLWDAQSGRELATLRGHENHVRSVAFSPDGRRVVSGSDDHTIRLWDAQNGQEVGVFRGHVSCVASVAFSTDGRRVVSGSWDKTARLWDAQSGRELAVLSGHEDKVNGVAFSPDGLRVVSGSWDKTVRLWDAQSGQELAVLRGHEERVTSVAFSPEGSRIVSGSGSWGKNTDNAVRLWDAQSGRELAILRGHEGWVNSVAFSPDGLRVLSGSDDQTVRLWDAQSGRELTALRGHESHVCSVAFSPDGLRLISGSEDKTVRLWEAQIGREVATLRGHEGCVFTVAFSSDGLRLVSRSEDKTVRLWDTQAGRELAFLRGHGGTFSPDGLRLVSGSEDKTARLWDTQTGRELAVLSGHEDSVHCLAFSPDCRRVISGSKDHTVRLWDAQGGREMAVLRGHGGTVYSVAFSPDGLRLVSGSEDKTVRLWDAQTGRELAVLCGHEGWVFTVTFSPDGSRVASGSRDGTVRLWETRGGRELAVLRGHENMVMSVAFSADGRRVVSESEDKTVRLWDAQKEDQLEVLQGHGDITAIAAGATAFPWRAMARDGETVIELAAGGPPMAWFPGALASITTHPKGDIWAGGIGNHLVLLRLEGGKAGRLGDLGTGRRGEGETTNRA